MDLEARILALSFEGGGQMEEMKEEIFPLCVKAQVIGLFGAAAQKRFFYKDCGEYQKRRNAFCSKEKKMGEKDRKQKKIEEKQEMKVMKEKNCWHFQECWVSDFHFYSTLYDSLTL